MKKFIATCTAVAVVTCASLTADAQNRNRGEQFRRGNVQQQFRRGNRGSQKSQRQSKNWKWNHKGGGHHGGGDHEITPPPTPTPKPAPKLDGLTFRNRTNKPLVMYMYYTTNATRIFANKDIRVEPNGTATWPGADNNRSRIWVKAMELNSVLVVAPEKLVNATNVIDIYPNAMRTSR